MIVSLMELALEESSLSMEPKIEQAIESLKKVLKTDDVYFPNPIQLDNPMYSQTVSKDEWKELLSIYKDLLIAEHTFVSEYGPQDEIEYTANQENIMKHLTAAQRFILQISRNMNNDKDIQTIQDEIMDEILKRLKEEK